MFDHHSHTHSCQSALLAFSECLEKRPSIDEKKQWEETLFRFVDAPEEALFQLTSSGAEAIVQVIWSVYLKKALKEGKTHFITSCIEDAPFLQMLKHCETLGCTIHIVPVDKEGKIDLDQLQKLINPRTALISFSMAHALTGVIQPFEEIGKIAKAKGVYLHLDASWIIGKMPVSFNNLDVDYLSFSGDGIHSIPGTGALFVKKDCPFVSLIPQATFHCASLSALSCAAKLAQISFDSTSLETARLRNLFEEKLLENIPGLQILFSENMRLPNTTTMIFPKVHHETLAFFLEKKGVFPNQSGYITQKLEKVLEVMQIKTESALSFSFSRMTTEEEITKGVQIITESIQKLQTLTVNL